MSKINRKSFTKRPNENSYFSGTIHCGICEAKLRTQGEYSKNKDGETVVRGGYKCPNVEKGLCNNATRLSHKKIEVAFQEFMNNIPDIKVADDVELEEKNKQDSLNNLLREEYENAIAKLEKKEKDVMTIYINDQITFNEYTQMTKIMTTEKEGYIELLKCLEENQDEDILLTRDNILTNFRENWKLLTNAEKLQFLQNYIEKITAVSKKEENYQVKVLKVKFYND